MASYIFYGGEIITMDDNTVDKVEAIAVSGDTIIEVGSIDQVFSRKGPNTQMILLNGQTLMPGFIEPHQHAIMCCMNRTMYTDVSGVKYLNYEQVSKAMKDRLQEITDNKEDAWGLFFGWDPELIQDLPKLSNTYLDKEFSSEIPMFVIGQSGHVAWCNSKAFEIAGITDDVEQPDGGTFVKDEEGKLTGQLFEASAMLPVIEHAGSPTPEQITNAIATQCKYYASVGLTTVTDIGYLPNPDVDPFVVNHAESPSCPIRLGLYRMMTNPGEYGAPGQKSVQQKPKTQHLCCNPKIFSATAKNLKPPKGVRTNGDGIGNHNEFLWEVGIKIVEDGSPHCGTAAYREPFMNTPLTENLGFPAPPQYGYLNFSREVLYDAIKQLHTEGKQVAVHCHGERACETVLKVYEQIQSETVDADNKNRNRIEHCGLMTVDQIARAGKINTALSFFVDHLRFYANVYKTDIFGEERVNRWTPLSEATKNKVTWTIHQDHPTFPGNAAPFANMKTAVTRCHRDDNDHSYGPEYRVPIHEALKSYTTNAAWQLHLDDKVGTITKGKKADLVILSDNPYHQDPFKLEEISVVETFMSGRRNNIGLMTALASGINILRRDPQYDV